MPKNTIKPGSKADGIDKTHKLFIGGMQARPDSGYSINLETTNGIVEVPRGNRKDLRNAVEANDAASGWANATAFNRSQVLYYLAENMEDASESLARSLTALGASPANAKAEVEQAIDRVLYYAALADKYDAESHKVPARMHVYTIREAIGSTAVVCPNESPLLGFVSTCIPLISMGNAVTAIPSYENPLPALEMYRIIEASDVPAGVWNIVTGTPDELEKTLAEHDGIQAIWHFGTKENGEAVQAGSIGNLKQTWCLLGKKIDWTATPSTEFLRRATQIKNVWVPYGA